MAVRLVWGRCDGNDVMFSQTEGGAWTAQVPAHESGTYIVELWAEDYAGNVAYFATVQITFDPENLCYTVTIIELGDGVSLEDVAQLLQGDGLETGTTVVTLGTCVELVGLEAKTWADALMGEITRCEVCA